MKLDPAYVRQLVAQGATIGPSAAEGLARLDADCCYSASRGGTITPRFDSEATFQNAVVELARIRGWRVGHFRKVRVQRKDGSVYWQTPVGANGKGFVDLVLVRNVVIWAELKMPTGRVKPDQADWHAALKRTGQLLYVWLPQDFPEIEAVLQ